MTVFMTNMKSESASEVVGPERRRRWSLQDKLQMVRESYEPGNSVSMVARRHEVNPNQLFQWRKLHQAGALSAVSAGEAVVPASELAKALQEIKALQRVLGKKSLENEILKEAAEYGRAKNWIARAPLLPEDDR